MPVNWDWGEPVIVIPETPGLFLFAILVISFINECVATNNLLTLPIPLTPTPTMKIVHSCFSSINMWISLSRNGEREGKYGDGWLRSVYSRWKWMTSSLAALGVTTLWKVEPVQLWGPEDKTYPTSKPWWSISHLQ